MGALRTNILVNYAGQVWIALMAVAFLPLYIRVLGIEAFGLVGLMLSLQALSLILDLGMGAVLNRELARRVNDSETRRTIRDLVRTFEYLVWPIALLIAGAAWLASGPIAAHWLHPEHLTTGQTAHIVSIMGLAVALQWPSSFYSNGLSGLEHQTAMNAINAGFATLRGAGVLLVLYFISPSIEAFMWWYAAMGLCQSATSALVLQRLLPPGCDRSPRFQFDEVRSASRFAGGLLAITAFSVMATQLDRVVLSAMRPLAELGYYSLALSVAAAIGRAIQPMFNALYPRYSRLVAASDEETLRLLYHLSSQCLAVVTAASSAVLILYSKDVVFLWTGNATTAANVALPLAILAAGSAVNGLMHLPYALQLAHGSTRLTAQANFAVLIVGIPYSVWAVGNFGSAGAASLWLASSLGFITILLPIMHRQILRGELTAWYCKDVLPPYVAAFALAGLSRMVLGDLPRTPTSLIVLVVVAGLCLFAAALSAPQVRRLGIDHLSRKIRIEN